MFAAHLNAAPVSAKTYVEDVFGINLRTGTGATASVTGMPNLATYGGMVHTKGRGAAAWPHVVVNSSRGKDYELYTHNTNAQSSAISDFASFNSNGFSLTPRGTNSTDSSQSYVDWIWRNAPKFFKETTVTKTAGSNATVDLSTLGTVGMVKVKRTDAAGSWYIWHRSLTAGKLLIGETTAAEATLGHITVSGTTLTLVDGVIANGTYHIEAYAHDTSADGLIQCGSFTTGGTGTATINLTFGWECQHLEFKCISTTSDWIDIDNMRGFADSCQRLSPNLSSAESSIGSATYPIRPTATGCSISEGFLNSNATYAYRVVRRGPMKPPTSGTQVYNAIARTGTGAAATVTGVGFSPDLVFISDRNRLQYTHTSIFDRLRGAGNWLATDITNAESNIASTVTSFDMDGVSLGTSVIVNTSTSSTPYINHFLRRYPGVFDEICYGGTGSNKTEAHNLTVQPELWRSKRRDSTGNWVMGSTLLAATEKILLNSTSGKSTDATAWNSAYPTASAVNLGTLTDVNASGGTFVMWLYATTPGVSKVGLITCTGSDMNIDAGFAAGARYIEIFRSDGTSSRYVFDSTRGIVAGNDPYLALDSTAAEVTGTDYIDPYAPGFTVTAAAPWNVAGAHALYFAIA